MAALSFKVFRGAWDKFKTERLSDLKRLAPFLNDPNEIYLKQIDDNDTFMVVEFSGLTNASDNPATAVPQIKRMIYNWVRRFSADVAIQHGSPENLILRISKELKFTEANVSVFKRDPKTNKAKRYYKCIGGKKDGRKVADPNDCIGVPDWNKKMNFGISKRAKYGQASKAKTKTRLTNLVSKRVRKANQRLKKARGF